MKSIINKYTALLEEHGISHLSLDWGSQKSQYKRFEVLTRAGNLENHSILDFGCGIGDFYNYLTTTSLKNIQYTGYDITPAMIEVARQRFKNINFECRGLQSIPENRFDFIFASGIFYLQKENGYEFIEHYLSEFLNKCNLGIAANFLSNVSDGDSDEFIADPSKIINIVSNLSSSFTLHHDYLPHDFTIVINK